MACTVIVGTYEKLVLGYELSKNDDDKWEFKLEFTNNAHLAPVRCLAVSASRGILASAGTDEAIRLLDLKRRVEVGSLPFHSGSINALHFYKASHLFSCSDDGKMVVWRRRDWRMLKAFKRHKGQPVKGVAVHPTGCLALSVGNDRTLRTWDLIAGKNAFSINLKQSAQSVMWSPDGSYFAVVFESWVDIYSAEMGRICASFPESAHSKESSIISPSKKITTAIFITDDVILFAMESGLLYSANVGPTGTKTVVAEVQAHSLRVKGIGLVSLLPNNKALVITASSDGEIKLWKHKLPPSPAGTDSFECLASHRSDFRILSLAIWTPESASTPSKKSKGVKVTAKSKPTADKKSPKKLKKSNKQRSE